MAGRPRKLAEVKSISGTDRPDREQAAGVELPTLSEIPKPPTWLPNAHAVKEWKRLAPILIANKLLTEASLSAFGMLCSIHGKIVQLMAAHEMPSGHLLAQYRGYINDFGLTPMAQGKVKSNGSETPKTNQFSKNGKRAS